MRLEQLYLNFGKSSPEEQLAFISSYRLRRAQDLEKSVPSKKKSSTSTKVKLELTAEEKMIMKMLGLKQKDVIALREAKISEEEDEELSGELFEDPTFDEEGEE